MVDSHFARRDVDKYLLTKELVYICLTKYKNDLLNDEYKYISTKYRIRAQVTLQQLESRYVAEGRLTQGDLVGLFRYEYSEQTNGFEISPPLVPKQGDYIEFLGKTFIIKSCTPATSEDNGIIGWDFTAGQSGDLFDGNE